MPHHLGDTTYKSMYSLMQIALEIELLKGCKLGSSYVLKLFPQNLVSKVQSTVESSTFGSEFIAMLIYIKMLETLQYKLRMFGIPINGPCNVFCENKLVVTNVSTPISTLKKNTMLLPTIMLEKQCGSSNFMNNQSTNFGKSC